MSLVDVGDRLVVAIADALRACGEQVAEARYVGPPPADACCERDQVLYVWWDRIESERGKPCPQMRVQFTVEWLRCWPVPNVTASGEMIVDRLAEQQITQRVWEIAACGFCGLREMVCSGQLVADSCRGLELGSVTPVLPQGGCAGVRWQVTALIGCN